MASNGPAGEQLGTETIWATRACLNEKLGPYFYSDLQRRVLLWVQAWMNPLRPHRFHSTLEETPTSSCSIHESHTHDLMNTDQVMHKFFTLGINSRTAVVQDGNSPLASQGQLGMGSK